MLVAIGETTERDVREWVGSTLSALTKKDCALEVWCEGDCYMAMIYIGPWPGHPGCGKRNEISQAGRDEAARNALTELVCEDPLEYVVQAIELPDKAVERIDTEEAH
jgi:hypothetical protein